MFLQTLKEIFTSPAGSFASVLAFLLFILWLAVKAGKIIERFKIVDKLETAIDKIKDDISEIKAFMKVFLEKSSEFTQTSSPRNLNEKGHEISDKINAKVIIKSQWSQIEKDVKLNLKETDNPYTIQQACFDVGKHYSKYTTPEQFDMIKRIAFNEGHNLYDYDILFGIEIRDRYFTEHKINVREVDIHDPAQKGN